MGQSPTTGSNGNSTSSQRVCVASCTSRKMTTNKSSQSTRKDMIKEYLAKCRESFTVFSLALEQANLKFDDELERAYNDPKYFSISKEEWERRIFAVDKFGCKYSLPFPATLTNDIAKLPITVGLMETGVRDISDLKKMHKSDLADFIDVVSEGEQEKGLLISPEGYIDLVNPVDPHAMRVVFPARCDKVECGGKDATYRVRLIAGDAEHKVELNWSGKIEDLPDFLHRVVTAGYDEFSILVSCELVVADFWKKNVVEAKELETNTEVEAWAKCWVVTEYVWAVLGNFSLKPTDDFVIQLASDVALGIKTKDKALSEIASRGNSKDEMNIFLKMIGEGHGVNHERFIKEKAAMASSRLFSVSYCDGRASRPLHSTDAGCTIAGLCSAIELHLCDLSKNPENWQLCLGWEPVKLVGVEEHLHYIKQMQGHGKADIAMETAVRALELITRKSKGMTYQKSLIGMPDAKKNDKIGAKRSDIGLSLQNDEVAMLLQIGRDMIDKCCKMNEDGILSKDRFEDQVTRNCKRMIDFCTDFLIPMAEQAGSAEYNIFCLRTRADFMRLLLVNVPGNKEKEDECMGMYNHAISKRNEVNVWCQAILSSYANAAMFAVECLRNREEAILLCTAGKNHVQSKPPGITSQPSTGAFLTWSLLESNRRAIASWLVLLVITFEGRNLQAHAEEEQVSEIPYQSGDSQIPEGNGNFCSSSIFASRNKSHDVALEKPPKKKPSSYCGIACLQCATPRVPQAQGDVCEDETYEDESASKDLRAREQAVRTWLRTRPLHANHFKDIESLKWVNSVSPYEIRQMQHVADFNPMREGTFEDSTMSPTDAKVENPRLSVQEELVKTSHDTFLLAVTLLPRQKEDDAESNQDGLSSRSKEGSVGWTDSLIAEFKAALRSWPDDERDTSKPFSLGIRKGQVGKVDLSKVLDALQDGVVKMAPGADEPACRKCNYVFRESLTWCPMCRAPRLPKFWRINGVRLYAGDTLVQTGEQGQSLEHLRTIGEPHTPLTLYFIAALRVTDCRVFVRGGYADFHEHFRGWTSPGNLDLASEISSNNVNLARVIRDNRLALKSPRPPPKRIRGLSARREVLSAASRGCK